MPHANFRIYAELNYFLPPEKRQVSFELHFAGHETVKHLLESLGIPHTEVDLILANGVSVDFAYQVEEGDRVSVYPVFEALDVASVTEVRPEPLREPRFVLDSHLRKLAGYLRLLGFDTLYENDFDDAELAEISSSEERILLTRDRGLLKRKIVTHGYCVRDSDPRAQIVDVLRRFDLGNMAAPFARCARCNGILEPVPKEEVFESVLAETEET